jgi:prefoldin alpha subunit
MIMPDKEKEHADDKAKQEVYMELQLLDQKIKKVQKQLEKLEEQLADVGEVKNALEQFADIQPGTEMRVPLANGIFFRAELKDATEVLVNVGSNIIVAKKVVDVRKMIDGQLEELTAYRTKVVQQFEKLVERVEGIQKDFKDEETG